MADNALAAVAAPAPIDPHTVAQHIGRAWETWLLKGRRQTMPHGHVWASAWRTCERRMVLELTVPDQQPPFEAKLLAKFRRGDDRERDLLADLHRIGRDAEPSFDVIAQQERFELRGRDGSVAIAGKVDARLRVDGWRSAPLEVKAWAATLVDRIEVFEDVFENPWTYSGGLQLLSYLYGANEPCGFLLLDRSGLPQLLPVELTAANLERLEEFLARSERVVAHRNAGTLPPFLEDDPSECTRCPFYGGACNPPLISKVADVISDAELESDLERWHQLRDAGREWQRLDRDLKDRMRGVESAIVGHFALTGRWGKQSRVDVPAHLKKQFTVTDPKGRFTLEIERL